MRAFWPLLLLLSAWAHATTLPVFPNEAPVVIQQFNGGQIGPNVNSVSAVQATAANNSLCTGIVPFYWEI